LSAVQSPPRTDEKTLPVLEAVNLLKTFGAVTALRDGNLTVAPNEVHAIVGDNGAGKSTLVKLLSGVFQPDSGEILLSGEPVRLGNPTSARLAGVATVYQDLALVNHLDVAANLFLGNEIRRRRPLGWFGFMDKRTMRRKAIEEMRRLKIGLTSVDQLVAGLSGGQRQAVAVARGVALGTRVLILDEPTAALGVRESEAVIETIREVRSHGLSVVMISHNLQEVFSIADRVTVLRLGRTVDTLRTSSATPRDVVELITGASEGSAK
jgi:ABC-type sugar transport system ATPase subunit